MKRNIKHINLIQSWVQSYPIDRYRFRMQWKHKPYLRFRLMLKKMKNTNRANIILTGPLIAELLVRYVIVLGQIIKTNSKLWAIELKKFEIQIMVFIGMFNGVRKRKIKLLEVIDFCQIQKPID